MKHYRKTLSFSVPSRRGFINITPQVEQALAESGIREGLLLCNAMHITASVFINDCPHCGEIKPWNRHECACRK